MRQHLFTVGTITLCKERAAVPFWDQLGYILGGILKKQKQWIVLSGLSNLRIAQRDGAPSNEYRIQQHAVEFRALDARGKPDTSPSGHWRALDGNEIKLHFALQTPVAEWLDKNLYAAPLAA
jgi:predicted ester cyclase